MVDSYFEETLTLFSARGHLQALSACYAMRYPRLSEQKTNEKFVELPLCLIKERYEKLPGGKELIADILKSLCLKLSCTAYKPFDPLSVFCSARSEGSEAPAKR